MGQKRCDRKIWRAKILGLWMSLLYAWRPTDDRRQTNALRNAKRCARRSGKKIIFFLLLLGLWVKNFVIKLFNSAAFTNIVSDVCDVARAILASAKWQNTPGDGTIGKILSSQITPKILVNEIFSSVTSLSGKTFFNESAQKKILEG